MTLGDLPGLSCPSLFFFFGVWIMMDGYYTVIIITHYHTGKSMFSAQPKTILIWWRAVRVLAPPTDISRDFAAISLSPNIRQPMAIGTGWLQNSGWRASAADRPAKPPKWAMLCVPTPQAPKTSTLVSLVRSLNSMARLLWFEELIAVQTKKTHRRDVDQPLHLTFTWPYLILSDWKSLQLCTIYLL